MKLQKLLSLTRQGLLSLRTWKTTSAICVFIIWYSTPSFLQNSLISSKLRLSNPKSTVTAKYQTYLDRTFVNGTVHREV